MAENIKGITIQFEGDTVGLDSALKKIGKESKVASNKLNAIDRALKFNPRNVELLTQKQKLLEQRVDETRNSIERLKNVQNQLKAKGVKETSAEYQKVRREIIEAESKCKHFEAELKRFGSVGKQQARAVADSFKVAGGKIKTAGRSITTSVSVWGMAGIYAGGKLIEMSEKQAKAELKLEEIYKSRMKVGKKAAQVTIDLAAAEQKTGVVADEVALAGAQQLATYANYPSTVNTILPALEDLLVQQKGLNGTQEDAVGLANLFGKAMMGQTGALKRAGISFTDEQEKVLKFGTEEEKAAMLAEVVRQNVGDMNQTFAETDAGKIQQAKNALGDMGEQIGAVLLPAVADLVSWFQDNLLPKLQQFIDFMKEHPQIAKFALVLAGIVAVAGPLLMFIGSLIGMLGSLAGVATALDVALLPVIGVVAAIVAGIAAAVAIGIVLYKNWDKIKAKAVEVWATVKEKFAAIKDAIMQPIRTAVNFVKQMIEKIKSMFKFKVSLPHVKLPHFTIRPAGWKMSDLLKGKIPKLGIKWYAQGGIVDGAQLIGAGEGGPEGIIPLSGHAMQPFADAIAQNMNIDYNTLADAIVSALTGVDTTIVLNVDGKQVATTTAPYMNGALNQLQARQSRRLGIVGV